MSFPGYPTYPQDDRRRACGRHGPVISLPRSPVLALTLVFLASGTVWSLDPGPEGSYSVTLGSSLSDTDLHQIAGIAVGLTAATLAVRVQTSGGAAALGLGAAFVAGAMKEIVDLIGPGTAELRDLGNTLIGGLAAGAVVLWTDLLYEPGMAGAFRQRQIFTATMAVSVALPLGLFFLERIAGAARRPAPFGEEQLSAGDEVEEKPDS